MKHLVRCAFVCVMLAGCSDAPAKSNAVADTGATNADPGDVGMATDGSRADGSVTVGGLFYGTGHGCVQAEDCGQDERCNPPDRPFDVGCGAAPGECTPDSCEPGQLCEPLCANQTTCRDGCSITGCEPYDQCEAESGRCVPVDDCATAACPPQFACTGGAGADARGCVRIPCESNQDCPDGGSCWASGCYVGVASCVTTLSPP